MQDFAEVDTGARVNRPPSRVGRAVRRRGNGVQVVFARGVGCALQRQAARGADAANVVNGAVSSSRLPATVSALSDPVTPNASRLSVLSAGEGSTDHVLPSQCSISAWSGKLEPDSSPTAYTLLLATVWTP